MPVFGKNSLAKLEGVLPLLQTVMKTAITTSPIDFSIIEGVRTTKRQQELYAQGRTTKGSIVTYADGVKNKSNHQVKADGYGHAVDIYPYVNGKIDFNDTKSLKIISDHIKKVAKDLKTSITWGGDWKNPYDPPHFELK